MPVTRSGSTPSPLEGSLLRLRFQHMKLLVALQESASVNEAATRMRLTQSAASKLLADIEFSFGARLFERGRLGLRATPAGAALAVRAGRMLRDVEAAREELHLLEQGASTLLRVGGLPVTLATDMPRVLAACRERWPGLVLQLREATGRQLLRDVETGVVDCGIGRALLDEPIDTVARSLQFSVLKPESLLAVVRRAHPLARRRRVSIVELARHDWLTPAVGSSAYTVFAQAFQRAGVAPPRPAIECDASFGTLVTYLRRFNLVGMLPDAIANDPSVANGLVRVDTRFRADLPPLAFIARGERFEAPELARFREICALATQPAA